ALKDVSFAVEMGSIFGLLGPNGAGKSTLIHLLTGMIPFGEGSNAYLSGKDVQEEPWESHATMGICPQHDIHWGELTIEEHLSFYARLRGVTKKEEAEEMVEDVLSRMALSHVRHSYAETLSGGERRRLSIGLAILGGQSVVFLDEPTTGLDPDARRMIWRIIQGLRMTSTTIILTTHSMEEAEALCGRIAIMNQGQIQVIGSPVHLRDKFSQGFRLTITYQSGRRQGVLRFLKSILPGKTRAVEDIGTSLVLEFPSSAYDRVPIGPIMRSIDTDGRTNAGILEWAIGQTSLEAVFLHIIDSATVN
ncbi:P-loop containing nucleoside triphosphate hydrolase protein, partial [Piptocephalis cylindrospora]